MYQPPKCPYLYFSKAMEFYLRVLFPVIIYKFFQKVELFKRIICVFLQYYFLMSWSFKETSINFICLQKTSNGRKYSTQLRILGGKAKLSLSLITTFQHDKMKIHYHLMSVIQVLIVLENHKFYNFFLYVLWTLQSILSLILVNLYSDG